MASGGLAIGKVGAGRRRTTQFTYWQDDDGMYLGYLNQFPDHWTQGRSLEDLKEHLRDLHATFHGEANASSTPAPSLTDVLSKPAVI